jgi:hypothetical protein
MFAYNIAKRDYIKLVKLYRSTDCVEQSLGLGKLDNLDSSARKASFLLSSLAVNKIRIRWDRTKSFLLQYQTI